MSIVIRKILEKPRVWEFLTASLEEKSSFQNREFENFASLESRICEDLMYMHKYHVVLIWLTCINLVPALMDNWWSL